MGSEIGDKFPHKRIELNGGMVFPKLVGADELLTLNYLSRIKINIK